MKSNDVIRSITKIRNRIDKLLDEVSALERESATDIKHGNWDRLYESGYKDGMEVALRSIIVSIKKEEPVTIGEVEKILESISKSI